MFCYTVTVDGCLGCFWGWFMSIGPMELNWTDIILCNQDVWLYIDCLDLTGLKKCPGKKVCGSKKTGPIQSPNLGMLNILNISSMFVSQHLSFLSWRSLERRPLSAHSYSVRMRFSWPGIYSNLRMFRGLSMTKSSIYSRAIWVQLPAPVGGKTEMRFNLPASIFNPVNSPTLGKLCWQADELYMKTYIIKANKF